MKKKTKAKQAAATHQQKRRRIASISPTAKRSRPVLINPEGSEVRSVLVLFTGGTFGSTSGSHSGEPGHAPLAPAPSGQILARLKQVEELAERRMPRVHFMEFEKLIDSADMTPQDWNKIASIVADNYFSYDGFVVIQGTDTMAYTASALSFMLEQLAKPVILTGAQIPLFEPINDARQNLVGAVVFAGLADISEVCIFFNGHLMRGNRAVKFNSTQLDAFVSPCYPLLAETGAEITVYHRRLRDPPRGRFRLHLVQEHEVAVVWLVPGFSHGLFRGLGLGKGGDVKIKGIVLVAYGSGNASKDAFLSELRDLHRRGVVIAACSQCMHGTVAFDKYAAGKALSDAGVVSCSDMTTESATAKLKYLLSKGLAVEEVRRLMGEDLRGELSTEAGTFKINEPVTGIKSL